MRSMIALAAVALAVFPAVRPAAGAFSDDFESYGSTAEMLAAGAWGDDGGSASNASLAQEGGNQFLWDPDGGLAARHLIEPLIPTHAQPLIWEFDFYDPDETSKRMTGSLRAEVGEDTTAALLEMGVHNAMHPETGATWHTYCVRTVFIGGDPEGLGGWVTFSELPSHQTGWHRFRAVIGASQILFELDLLKDGHVDGTRVITTADGAGVAYNVLRLGGPSDVSSVGGAGFDNVSIDIPEPASVGGMAVLVALGLLLMRRGGWSRRRRP